MVKKGTVKLLPRETVLHVRDTCLCLAAQRAARRLARHFDHALKPLGLTNEQFSLLMALNQPEPPSMRRMAALMAMEPSTLTAAVRVLERRGLLTIERDALDGRSRRPRITRYGVSVMRAAVELWRQAHASLNADLSPEVETALREGLTALARLASPKEHTQPPSTRA